MFSRSAPGVSHSTTVPRSITKTRSLSIIVSSLQDRKRDQIIARARDFIITSPISRREDYFKRFESKSQSTSCDFQLVPRFSLSFLPSESLRTKLPLPFPLNCHKGFFLKKMIKVSISLVEKQNIFAA